MEKMVGFEVRTVIK